MHLQVVSFVALIVPIVALQNHHARASAAIAKLHQHLQTPERVDPLPNAPSPLPKAYMYLNPETESFLVNGTAFPGLDFDLGESYAGLLPNGPSGNSSLFFWFFPSSNPQASSEITVWLNGGPGCSSLVGLLQENGPVLWQPGTSAPIRNPYSWTNLTNMVYVDQPAGTGFSPGPPSVFNEVDVANQFNDFWKNFMTVFGLQYRHVYLTGESYAGQYIPYIADNMLDRKDTSFYNLKGIQINDPSINEFGTLSEAPAAMFMNYWARLLALNETFMADINRRAVSCGYTKFMDNALRFPPPGPLPPAPNSLAEGCGVWGDILEAATYVNPCFNIYHISDFCPFTSNVLGFPSLNPGPIDYFNQSDVQAALHVPPTDYLVCGEYELLDDDGSVPSGLGPLPRVIEATNNTIIAHGQLDFVLIANGTLATIQNMTWNGAQGFQTAPPADKNLFAPYHDGLAQLSAQTATAPFVEDAGA
ncbi:MAG: hypothetical protein L6R39_003051, partial [Caloplaca ligustica]